MSSIQQQSQDQNLPDITSSSFNHDREERRMVPSSDSSGLDPAFSSLCRLWEGLQTLGVVTDSKADHVLGRAEIRRACWNRKDKSREHRSKEDCAGCITLQAAIEAIGEDSDESLDVKLASSLGAVYLGVFFEQAIDPLLIYSIAGLRNPWGLKDVPASQKSISSSIDLVRAWLDKCRTSDMHEDCRLPEELTALPTRVLDVGSTGDPAMNSARIRLLESKGKRARYVCLSYCWGTGDLNLKTTPENLQRHTNEGLAFDELPLTFQHTATIARGLGIQYIWIDSLCIIQDEPDKADWNRESGYMADVYHNSYLTVSATWGNSPRDGIFTTPEPGLKAGSVLVRRIEHFPETRPTHKPSSFQLLSRGWTYQEHLLPPRVVHFGRDEMVWSCFTDSECECRHITYPARGVSKYKFYSLMNHPWETIDHYQWREIVVLYSEKQLTYVSDKLPALSGLADACRSNNKQTYLAGLWKETLIEDMCWIRSRPLRQPAPPDSPGASYLAPRWSWVSVDGPVRYFEDFADSFKTLATVIDAECSPMAVSVTGAVVDGFARLKCHLISILPSLITSQEEDLNEQKNSFYPPADVQDRMFQWWFDTRAKLEQCAVSGCYVIPMVERSAPEPHVLCLVVEPIAPGSSKYTRIGLLRFGSGVLSIMALDASVAGDEQRIMELV